MKQAILVSPKGVVRDAPAPLAHPADADALLNLRPQGGGWQPVGAKTPCHAAHVQGGTLLRLAEHRLLTTPQLVAVRQLADASFQIAAAPLESEQPVWQTLVSLPAGTTVAEALKVHIAFVGNFCCLSTPTLRIFRFTGTAYEEEATAVDSAPALSYSVQGRYTNRGGLLSFSVPVTGENLEGCYYRERASGQYPDALLSADNADGVILTQNGGNTPKQWGNLVFAESEKQALLEAMAGQYEQLQSTSDYYREGYVLVCSAWQLADGSYTCPSEPVLLHLGCEKVKEDMQTQLGVTFDPTTDTDVYFNRDKVCFRQFSANGISTTASTLAAFSCQVRRQWVQQLTFNKPGGSRSEVFRKAVYFVSPPVSMYQLAKADFDYLHTIYHYGTDATTHGLVEGDAAFFRVALAHAATHHEGLTEYLPTAADVANWILYKAVEFDLTDPDEATSKRVDFSTLMANEVLGADLTGHLQLACAGLLAYNQRLHLYNCTSTLKGVPVSQTALADVPAGFLYRYAEMPLNAYVTERYVVPDAVGTPFARAVAQIGERADRQVVAQFRLANGNSYLYHYRTLSYQQAFADAGGNQWLAYPRFLAFPDNRCDQCSLFYGEQDGDGWRSVVFAMHPSAGFNFSFALHLAVNDGLNTTEAAYRQLEGGTPVSTETVNLLLAADGRTFNQPVTGLNSLPASGLLHQPDVLMVSAATNPYVYPPELAFHFGSEVTAVEVSTREISAAQTGQYPLAVFTSGGIWSMELGTTAFYSRQVPVSAEVNTGNRVLATPFGIVFLSAGGVKLLQGRQVSRLDAEAGGPVASALWQTTSMASVVGNKSGQLSTAAALADQHLSAPNGLAHWLVAGVELGYDAAHHELLLSGAALPLPLTCVYSFSSKRWFALGEVFYSFIGDLAVQKLAAGSTLCRLGTEVTGGFRPVALVSRPFALEHLGYTHLNRLLLHGNLQGGASTYSGLYVLASNNLADWRMVSAVQWQHQLSPQVRLPRSKCSWRFYAYAFFADVPAAFWLSDVELLFD